MVQDSPSKVVEGHPIKAPLASRALRVKIKRDPENQIRRLLKNDNPNATSRSLSRLTKMGRNGDALASRFFGICMVSFMRFVLENGRVEDRKFLRLATGHGDHQS